MASSHHTSMPPVPGERAFQGHELTDNLEIHFLANSAATLTPSVPLPLDPQFLREDRASSVHSTEAFTLHSHRLLGKPVLPKSHCPDSWGPFTQCFSSLPSPAVQLLKLYCVPMSSQTSLLRDFTQSLTSLSLSLCIPRVGGYIGQALKFHFGATIL